MWCKIFSVVLLCVTSGKSFENFKRAELQDKPSTGEPCEWEGKNGTCINFWNCFTNAIDHVHDKHPPVCKIENGEVFACCTSCFVMSNISSIIIAKDYGKIMKRTGQKSSDKCMEYMSLGGYKCPSPGQVKKNYDNEKKCYDYNASPLFRIIGGGNATWAEFPHMALLGYGDSESSAEWLCGGTIISKRYILTAAHCTLTQVGEVKYAALGILKRSDPRELWNVYEIDRFITHPDYHPPSSYNDIALIRTKKRIIFSVTVFPACLPRDDTNTKKGVATGWGGMGHRKIVADVLQKVTLSRFNNDECSLHYTPYGNLPSGYNHTTQMCYGDAHIGRDTCEGDSGGPLLAFKSCPPVVMGVISMGNPCGFKGAGLYTRVRYYVPWIESIVWP